MMEQNRQYDLEERLLGFSVDSIRLIERFPKARSGNYVSGNLASRIPLLEDADSFTRLLRENNELIHIFVSSIKTTIKNK